MGIYDLGWVVGMCCDLVKFLVIDFMRWMVVLRCRFFMFIDFGIGVDCIYFDVSLGCFLELGVWSYFVGVDCGSGVLI